VKALHLINKNEQEAIATEVAPTKACAAGAGRGRAD
jgi:hypothetical protein